MNFSSKPSRRAQPSSDRQRNHLAPKLPIPGDWYDADYFENGTKSYWKNGYTWPLFKSVHGRSRLSDRPFSRGPFVSRHRMRQGLPGSGAERTRAGGLGPR